MTASLFFILTDQVIFPLPFKQTDRHYLPILKSAFIRRVNYDEMLNHVFLNSIVLYVIVSIQLNSRNQGKFLLLKQLSFFILLLIEF